MIKWNSAIKLGPARQVLHKLSALASQKIFVSVVIGSLAFFYHFRFSLRPLDIYDISWLYDNDMAGPLLGWLHFLHEDWQWPLGHLSNPMYQMASSLSLMDAIPLASIILKALGVPTGVYQYHGYWFLLCYLLQAYAGLKIICLFVSDRKAQCLGTAFVTFSPILLFRSGHLALCAHWIVLFSLYGVLKENKLNKFNLVYWMTLVFCALTIHPYLILFTLSFSLFSCFQYLWDKNQRIVSNHLKATARFIGILGFTLSIAAVLDLTNFDTRQRFVGGLHFYTADIFMFFNSGGTAFFGPELWKFKMGQYEGFSYLGLGVILLIFIYCFDNWGNHKQNLKNNWRSSTMGPCLAAVGLLTIFSLGSNIRFFGKWLVDLRFIYEPFYPLLSSFRSNGRFIWAAFYFVILLLMIYRPKNGVLQRHHSLIMILIFILQLIDISPIRPTLRERKIPSTTDLFGTLAVDDLEKIVIIPPETNDAHCQGYHSSELHVAFNIYAAVNSIKINSSIRAHPQKKLFQKICEDSFTEIREQNLKKNTAYILQKQFAKSLPQDFLSVFCQDLSTHYTCNPRLKEVSNL